MSTFHHQIDRLEKEMAKISTKNEMLDSLLHTVVIPQLRSLGKAEQSLVKKAVGEIITLLREIFEVS